ncbi:MAG: ABC transporter substrate-binding protein [Pseudomonadota bacterium]
MTTRTIAGLTAALMVTAAPIATSATELVINHGWSSPAEVAALNVLREGLEAKGHTWVDLALPHDTGADIGLINLITGGNPPNVFMEAAPDVYRDLNQMGLGQPLTDYFAEHDITPHLADAVIEAITIDGEIMKIPTAVHIDGMVYYNKEVAEAAGVEPESWTSLDEMFDEFEKIRAAGYIPLAVGGQQWQVGYLTHALAAALAGDALFPKFYSYDPDPAAIDSEEMREVLHWLRRFQQEADEGMPNRDWNVTTNMVITGKALMQIHGDWMKGEWRAAGKVPGEDFGCINIPGTQGLSTTVDAWGILGGVSDEELQAQFDFASVVMDKDIAGEFAAAKGSSPVRLDVDVSTLDECSQAVVETLKNPELGYVTPHNLSDPDWIDSIWNVVFNYWSDPDMTPDEAIEQLLNERDAIFG